MRGRRRAGDGVGALADELDGRLAVGPAPVGPGPQDVGAARVDDLRLRGRGVVGPGVERVAGRCRQAGGSGQDPGEEQRRLARVGERSEGHGPAVRVPGRLRHGPPAVEQRAHRPGAGHRVGDPQGLRRRRRRQGPYAGRPGGDRQHRRSDRRYRRDELGRSHPGTPLRTRPADYPPLRLGRTVRRLAPRRSRRRASPSMSSARPVSNRSSKRGLTNSGARATRFGKPSAGR